MPQQEPTSPSRELPMIQLHEDRFNIDLKRDSLVFTHNADKKIPFSRMDGPLRNGFYSFLYDSLDKQIYVPPPALRRLPPQVLYLEIPNRGDLDPLHFALNMVRRTGEIPEEIYRLSAQEKTARVIPRVEFVGGDEFFVDIRKLAFVDTLNWRNEIPLGATYGLPNGKLFLEYDLNTRNVPSQNAGELNREAVTTVVLPPYKEIDPVGWELLTQNEVSQQKMLRTAAGLLEKKTGHQRPRSIRPPTNKPGGQKPKK